MRVFMLGIVFLLTLLFVSPTLATEQNQNLVSRVYVFEDGIFSFQHDQSIAVNLMPTAIRLVVGEFFVSDSTQPNLQVQISRPTPVAEFARVGFGDTPAAILASRSRVWQQTTPSILASTLNTTLNGVFSVDESELFLINGLTATSTTITYSWHNQTAAIFIAVLDVGNDRVVMLIASPALGEGASILASHQADISTILNSVRYTPHDGAVTIQALPLTYVGEIGRLRTGWLTFNYPKDWYILPVGGNILITNTNQLAIKELVSGQVQIQIIPPDFNLRAFADDDQIVNCGISQETLAQITPLAVIERQMLNPRRLASYGAEGVTYTAPQTTRLAEHITTYMMLFAPDRDALVIAADLGESNIASLMAFSAPKEMNNYTRDLFSIVASFRYESHACVDLTSESE